MSCQPYTLVRSHRRKRTVALMIEPEGDVRVIAPKRMSLRAIDAFVFKQTKWIKRKLEKLRAAPPKKSAPTFADGSTVSFRGVEQILHVTQNPAPRACCVLGDREITINIPDLSLSPCALRDEAKLELTLWYKKQARHVFKERLDHWRERLGVTPGRLIVTSPSRRWGSCNARNDIRLNWRLIMAPPALLDYVVAHELCHIVHKNHARGFWIRLAAIMPDCRTRRRELRTWERMHY